MKEDTIHLGHFVVGGKEYAGQLVVHGEKSLLEIYGDDFLHIPEEEMKRVIGIAKDGQSITCVNCVGAPVSGRSTYYGKTRHFMSLFPNFVLFGPRHLNPEQKEISALTFSFTRANMLFYDWGTFGHIIYKHPLSFGQKREILRSVRKSPKRRRRGGQLGLYYHWDRGPIIEVKTAVGTLTAYMATTSSFPSSSGINVRGQVRIRIDFACPQTLEEVLRVQFITMEFFELVAQSRQNVTHIETTHKDAEKEGPLRLYLSHRMNDDIEDLQPTEALVNGGMHSEEFERMLMAWLETHGERGAARRRFVDGFRNGRSYDADRLVGAANAFDLLPAGDFGKAAILPTDVETLVSAFEAEVKRAAENSKAVAEYKERLTNTLGLVRGSNLRSKVLARYADLPAELKKRLPEMEELIVHSIRARNYFVHGAEAKMSAEAVYDHAPFFTDTLEFVFAASELQMCGWDIARWMKESFSTSRLKEYVYSYKEHLALVKEAAGH